MGQMFRQGPARAGEGWDPAGVPPWQVPWWEETGRELQHHMSGSGGHRTLRPRFWRLGCTQPGKRPPPASDELSSGELFLAGLATLVGADVWESGVPLFPPQGVQTLVPSASSVLTSPPGGGMEDGAHGHGTRVPGTLTALSVPVPGRPNAVQNGTVPGPGT